MSIKKIKQIIVQTMETKVLHKKKLLTPKLRFRGFDGAWQKDRLINLTSVLRCGIASTPTYVEKGIPFLSAQNVTKDGEFSLHKYNFISEEYYKELSKNHTLLKGDILYSRVGAGFGTAAIFPFDGEYGVYVSLTHIRANTKLINPFLKFYLNSELCKEQASNGVFQGGGVPNLNVKIVEKFKINFPTVTEQQKIASFLLSIDKKIQQLTRKKELLEQYKKGMMQQLFSGKLRFKDEKGKAFPKWDMVGGDKLFDNISDKKHNSDLPILAITQDQGAIPREMINYQMTVTDSSIASYKVVQVGDFIISLRTFQGGIEYSNYKGICSPAYNILRPSSDDVNREFYKYYLKTSYYIKQLQKNLEGIRDGKMISYKYFSEIKLPFPSKEEQKKIARFLSTIDSKIEIVNKQITQIRTFKKGLLQQMFV